METTPPSRRELAGVAVAALALALCACAAPLDEPPGETARFRMDWDGATLQRDDFHLSGTLDLFPGAVPAGSRLVVRLNGEPQRVYATPLPGDGTGDATAQRFLVASPNAGPPLALHPDQSNLLEILLVSDFSSPFVAAPESPLGVLSGTTTEQLLLQTHLRLKDHLILIPVHTWSLGGRVPSADEQTMRWMLDKAPETRLGGSLWAQQRVDEVWAHCNIQFRHAGHIDGPDLPDCWLHPIVSNQSVMSSSCSTSNPRCQASSDTCQDFLRCPQQLENRCTFRELVRASYEQPGYDGPRVFKKGGINIYFAQQLELYEGMTLGIGCAGVYPMVVINDLWKDYSGLRVAHELGHVLGIDRHIPGTVMGDNDSRTDWIDPGTCQQVRTYVLGHYHFADGG